MHLDGRRLLRGRRDAQVVKDLPAVRKVVPHLTFAFTIKQAMTDEAPDLQVRLAFTGTETVDDVSARMDEALTRTRGAGVGESDRLVDAFVRLPRPVVAGIGSASWTLDALDTMPRVLQEALPMYASAHVVNLGSLGRRGTLPPPLPTRHRERLRHDRHRPTRAGRRRVRRRRGERRVDAVYTVDERATDGFYLVRSAELLQSILDAPERLLSPAGVG